jgi:hypothetical protein
MAISIQDNTSKCQIQVEIQLTDLQTARTAEASIRSLVSERMVYLSRKKPSNPDCKDRMYWNSSKSQKREVEYNRNQTSKLENRLLWSSSHDILELRRISQTLKIQICYSTHWAPHNTSWWVLYLSCFQQGQLWDTWCYFSLSITFDNNLHRMFLWSQLITCPKQSLPQMELWSLSVCLLVVFKQPVQGYKTARRLIFHLLLDMSLVSRCRKRLIFYLLDMGRQSLDIGRDRSQPKSIFAPISYIKLSSQEREYICISPAQTMESRLTNWSCCRKIACWLNIYLLENNSRKGVVNEALNNVDWWPQSGPLFFWQGDNNIRQDVVLRGLPGGAGGGDMQGEGKTRRGRWLPWSWSWPLTVARSQGFSKSVIFEPVTICGGRKVQIVDCKIQLSKEN